MDHFSVHSLELHPDLDYVEVRGDIDVHTGPRLRGALQRLVAGGHRQMIVSLQGVCFIDSTYGLGLLLGVLKQVRDCNGRLAVICSDRHILRLFSLTALDRVFEIYPDPEEAVKAFQPAVVTTA